MSCVIMIIMYVKDELSYDKFFKNTDHIFQVNMTFTDNGVQNTTGGNTAPAVGPTLMNMYPEVESYVRIYRPGDVLVRYDENAKTENYFTEKNVMAVDSNFLEVFNYTLLQGDATGCLQKPNSIVITASTAKKYFGNSNAIGKVLLLDTDRKPFIITAVLKDILSQSSFQFDMLASIHAYAEVKKRSWNWFWLQVNTYVKVKDNTPVDEQSIARLDAKFPTMVKEHAFNKDYGQSFEEFVKKAISWNIV